jgi:hypothetical protein
VDPVARLRDETGAATVITGSYYLVDDSLHFRVEITDARAGRLVSALPPAVTSRDSAQLAIPMLRDRLMGAAALLSDERLARAAEIARRPPLFEAYQAFDDGLQRYVAQDYEGAAPELRRAFALDTTFLTPLVYAMNAYWNRGEFAQLDSALRIVGPRRDELTAYGRLVVASLEARMAGAGESAREALREAVRLSPGSRAAYSFAVIALETDYAPDALTALRSLEPDRGAMRGWSSYWTQLTHALHLTGDHDGELAAARALRAAYPDRRVGVVLEARALAAAGRTEELEALMEAVSALPPTVYWSQGAAMVVAGEELRAHGFAAAGERWLARGDAWLLAQHTLTPDDRGHRYWLASARYDRGRWADAYQLFAALSREQPARLDYRGMTALAARRAGVPGADALLGTGPQHERGTHAAFRARLAALRGDHALAAAMLADAVRAGVDGLPWLHASAYAELAPLAAHGVSLPESLRRP